MAKPSLAVLASSILATLAVFMVGETFSFHLIPEGKRHFYRSRRIQPADPSNPPFGVNPLGDRCSCLGANTPSDTPWSLSNSSEPRRMFFTDLLSKGVAITGFVSSTSLPQYAEAADGANLVSTGTIKVTAIAHTFATTGKSPSPKPIRENDATRFFTNARVVYIFEGSNNSDNLRLAQEVTDLTRQRKAEKGPGVTPGNLQALIPDGKSVIIARVVETAKQMPDGDVLLVGPIPSLGTEGDGKLLASTASGLGTFVGGQKGQGVISVLLNGPKENLKLIESGLPASELLWYSLPPKP